MNSISTEVGESDSNNLGEMRQVSRSSMQKLTIDIAASAIFGAVSLVLSSYVVPTMPRVAGWGMAFFDPVSLIWIVAFLIFGIRAGVFTTIIGTFGLMIWDTSG